MAAVDSVAVVEVLRSAVDSVAVVVVVGAVVPLVVAVAGELDMGFAWTAMRNGHGTMA